MEEFRRLREEKKRRLAMKDAPDESESFHAGPVSVKPETERDSDEDSDTAAARKAIDVEIEGDETLEVIKERKPFVEGYS
jgi:hypothetical protein